MYCGILTPQCHTYYMNEFLFSELQPLNINSHGKPVIHHTWYKGTLSEYFVFLQISFEKIGLVKAYMYKHVAIFRLAFEESEIHKS